MANPEVILIAAVASNGIIGNGEALVFRIREDLQRFKALTTGGTVLMGRRTAQSIGKALPNRRTFVLTHDRSWHMEGITPIHSPTQALQALGPNEPLWVAGGTQVYSLMLPHATRLELTEVQAPAVGNVFFPILKPGDWSELKREVHSGPPAYHFVTYVKKEPTA